MKCKKCGAEMITKTDVNKAMCILQSLIEDIHFCFSCDVKVARKEWLKQILEKPSGPSCDECCRRGEDECLHERFGDLSFTSGEQNLSVRLDCPKLGDAHPVSRNNAERRDMIIKSRRIAALEAAMKEKDKEIAALTALLENRKKEVESWCKNFWGLDKNYDELEESTASLTAENDRLREGLAET